MFQFSTEKAKYKAKYRLHMELCNMFSEYRLDVDKFIILLFQYLISMRR